AEDRILETYINNLSEGTPECFGERWRPKKHTLYLLCGECTIILEDVNLQLSLLVDGAVFTRLVVSVDWSATCEQLMGKFGCTQCIPPQPQELNDLNMIDMRGRLDEDWATFHKKYIKIWQHMYNYLPTREPFLMPELATTLDYMD
ncbi:hypothetical protein Gotur_008681, partial [Gossypium turneri]